MSTQPDRKSERPPAQPRRDKVDEASEESFPASDPPSTSPSHAGEPAPPAPTKPRDASGDSRRDPLGLDRA